MLRAIEGSGRKESASPKTRTRTVEKTDSGPQSVDGGGAAGYVEMLKQLPEVRPEKVETLRKQIGSGAYLDPSKIDACLPRLLEDLKLPPPTP